jgi:hypothetical protein
MASAVVDANHDKATCLNELRDSYHHAINNLVQHIEQHLAASRRDSAERLQGALQRGVDLISQKLNARYMGVFQVMLHYIAEACGEAAAHELSERAFKVQGFHVGLNGGVLGKATNLPVAQRFVSPDARNSSTFMITPSPQNSPLSHATTPP